MELGYLTHVAGPGSPREIYRDTVALAVAAEDLGFTSFWVAQHHLGAVDGRLPSPLVLLAAVAQHTSTIRLGTAVIAAPLEDPLRLAEDAAVVDELSGGRLELGIGAGADGAAAQAFGRDHDTRHADCRAVADALCRWLEGSDLVPAAPGLRRRLWWATGSTAGVEAAAARGMGVISGRPAGPGSGVAADLAGYWTRALDEPRVALSRPVGVGEPPESALARWRADPAFGWATEVLAQTQPPGAGTTAQLGVMRALASAARSAPLVAATPASPAVPLRASGPPRRRPVSAGARS